MRDEGERGKGREIEMVMEGERGWGRKMERET